MSDDSPLRLGTRDSALARWQADWVAARLREHSIPVELVPVTTQGDQDKQAPIGTIGQQGVFTKELQRALLHGRIDLAVHSLKDMPTDEVSGLCLAAVPPRAAIEDALIAREVGSLADLPKGAVVGTGSLRRRAQLQNARPDLVVRDIRGNVGTRLAKLDDGGYDAILLARAGLERLELEARITEVLDPNVFLPAIGQGALGIEIRCDDPSTRRAVELLNDAATRAAVTAERAMLAALHGGCLAPIAAWGRAEDETRLVLHGRVLSHDGAERIDVTQEGAADRAAELGLGVADELISRGAAPLLRAARGV